MINSVFFCSVKRPICPTTMLFSIPYSFRVAFRSSSLYLFTSVLITVLKTLTFPSSNNLSPNCHRPQASPFAIKFVANILENGFKMFLRIVFLSALCAIDILSLIRIGIPHCHPTNIENKFIVPLYECMIL